MDDPQKAADQVKHSFKEAESHPFLNAGSPFYLNPAQAQARVLKVPKNLQGALWGPSETPNIVDLV